MTTAIDNSMPATRPGLNEHMVRSDHTESLILAFLLAFWFLPVPVHPYQPTQYPSSTRMY